MSDHSTHFQVIAGGLVLSKAILLYSDETPPHVKASAPPRQDAPAFASIHAIEHRDEGPPTIAAGVPLSRAHLRQWTEALGRTVAPEILPDNMLVAHPDMLAWWVPAKVRPAYFALSSPPDGLRALSQRTVLPVPYPAHLFVATRSGLGVYALPVDQRPTADTQILHSPILNVFVSGQLCWGNIAKPQALAIASIPAFERAVFDSWSTHANPGQELTVTGKGGLIRLWDDLAARRATRFPVRHLKPFRGRQASRGASAEPITVGKLVAMSTRR